MIIPHPTWMPCKKYLYSPTQPPYPIPFQIWILIYSIITPHVIAMTYDPFFFTFSNPVYDTFFFQKKPRRLTYLYSWNKLWIILQIVPSEELHIRHNPPYPVHNLLWKTIYSNGPREQPSSSPSLLIDEPNLAPPTPVLFNLNYDIINLFPPKTTFSSTINHLIWAKLRHFSIKNKVLPLLKFGIHHYYPWSFQIHHFSNK